MQGVYAELKANGIAFGLGQEEIFREMFEPFYKDSDSTKVSLVSNLPYGPDERNTLDIYFPVGVTSKPRAILIYIHGGGFFSGDKAWSSKVYGNIGNYFAEKDIVVVVPNHHLVPNAVYPQGANDIQLAREWVYKNVSSAEYGSGDINKVVLFGHSSGGAHVACNLYAAGDPNLPKCDPLFPPVAGVAYFSVPWWFDTRKPMRAKIITAYYGSVEESVWEPVSPLGLLKRVPNDSPVLDSSVLPTYLGTVKWETKEATDGALMFFNEYRARSAPEGTLPLYHVLDRHNHLSNILSIGTEDEEQALALLKFIHTCTQ